MVYRISSNERKQNNHSGVLRVEGKSIGIEELEKESIEI